MIKVGDKLASIALGSSDPEEVDLFGRSAINRYYYACFLVARSAALKIHPTLAIKHKQLPIDLQKRIADIVRDEIARLKKIGSLTDSEAIRCKANLNSIVSELAAVLEDAYKLRVLADYYPEKVTVKIGGHLKLEQGTNTAAKDWHRKASECAGKMLKLWRDLGH